MEEFLDKRPPSRSALRSPPRPEEIRSPEPRRDAAERARQILGNLMDLDQEVDQFWFDKSKIPPGWTYEWKEYTVIGKIDPARQVKIAKGGWEPVPADRHPEEMPVGNNEPFILRDGLRLMERPEEVTIEVNRRIHKLAADQVKDKREQLRTGPVGPFDRTERSSARASGLQSRFQPMDIPT